MEPSGPALALATAITGVTVAGVSLVLLAWPGAVTSEVVSSVALLAVGAAAAISCLLRSRRSSGRRRGAWRLIGIAGIIVVLGNLAASAVGGGTAGLSSGINDLAIAVALSLSIVALLLFPEVRSRRSMALLVLDGLVAGSAVLIIASALIYEELLASTSGGTLTGAAILVIPVLDVVVATIAVLMLVRAQVADRTPLALIAAGYLAYMLGDLNYAVQQAGGGYGFGTWTDLGWIVGYALILLAAWAPSDHRRHPHARHRLTEIAGTVTVFGILLAAGIVQNVNVGGATTGGRILLWVVLVLAAGGRELIISRETHELSRGLEHRVAAQTADLRHWAEQTRALLDSVADGIYGVDVAGRITFLNRSAREMLGLDDRVIGTAHPHDLFHAPAPGGAAFPLARCYVSEAIAHAAIARGEDDVYLRSDGTEIAVEIAASPIVDTSTQEVTGAVVAFRDTTVRREVERMKDRFLSVVSHELRTPLTSIRGSLGLMTSGALGELPPEVHSLAVTAEGSAERLARLINDILDVERLTAGSFDVRGGRHTAAGLISDGTAEFSALAQGAGVTIEVGEADGEVVADRDRVAQVLVNLVGNAVKFSDPGGTVRLSAAPVDDEVVFAVADEGRGIPADRLEDIFERFHQVDSSDARREGGTGLGLAITRAIIGQLGGRVWAESTVGVGSVFRFTLPMPADRRGPGPAVGRAEGQDPPEKSALK
ncbi:ATP-binding protein [Nocardioides sp.]|uniref:sensor histidine kinase n=1 Tax=Nocardioides sp. TaxID=35761 RepID=UPI0027329FC0|nr:ATP-binding protein [Nocardioides sp.]MDP3890949.1 ATP-binding protein [Nocardioides sp.]